MTEQQAIDKGYNDCKESTSSVQATSFASSSYDPPAGLQEAYDVGWERAARETAAALTRQERRGDVIFPILIGIVLLGGGGGLTLLSVTSDSQIILIAYGAIFTGAGMLIKGVAAIFQPPSTEAE